MAEVAGLVIGAAGLAALFDSCMSAFAYIESGASYGTEYQKTALKIALLQLRLSRWADPIQFVDGPVTNQVHVNVATSAEAEEVQDLLGTIYDTLKKAKRASERYKLKTPPPATNAPIQGRIDVETLTKRVQDISLHRQKHSSIALKARWALHDESKFDRLVNDLKSNITDLVELFPVLQSKQESLAVSDSQELIQLSGTEEPVGGKQSTSSVLQEAAVDVDALLERAIEKVRLTTATGHSYSNMETKDATAMFGDYVAQGSKRDQGSGSTYDKIKANGGVVMFGNSFGGTDVFGGRG